MHELSIALGILDAVSNEAERYRGAAVKAIYIKLGPLSGVVRQSLNAAYELAREGTVFADSELVVEETPLVLHCSSCNKDDLNASIQLLRCSRCGSNDITVIGGRELEVTALEIES